MHEIVILAKDENGEFKKRIREGIQKECDITLKLLPCFIQEIYKTWCDKCENDREDGCKKSLCIEYDDLEYIFIDHYWDQGER